MTRKQTIEQKLRISRLKGTRVCGECQACCEAHPIEATESPRWTRCEHQCEAGCAIYDRRPQECRNFLCLWMQVSDPLFIPDNLRPDRCGLMFEARPHDSAGRFYVRVSELEVDAANKSNNARLLDRLSELEDLELIRHGTTSRVLRMRGDEWTEAGALKA